MRSWISAVLFVLLAPALLEAARRAPERALQPTVSDRGWTLSIAGRRGTVLALDGSRTSFRVRRDERWLGFTASPEGWLATGVRADRTGLRLTLVADLGRGARRLASPPDRQGTLRTRPTAIVGADGLAGLAWLEGDDLNRFSVRVSALEGGSFLHSETISRPGAGSQTGLTAAVLEDGSWLLLWTRFDGRDDEVVWSKRAPGGEWTAPARIAPNNSVPDVTPALLAIPGGLLAAWSQLDGEYQVMTARYDGAQWSAPRSLGVRGTILPSFRQIEDASYLLVRNAWPGGWTAFEIDHHGQPLRFATVVEESRDAPILTAEPGRGLTFSWPHSRASRTLEWEVLQ